ncbi:hypothetical protein GIB67_039196 [Kingdonia uniflora]|uniref:Uncharacterized protein n=1 Tax=Kingdonia uniflora TaxID=39325 RepID=A0A7J7MLR3_9MAGN|nr:hypothetical protein GIB67_039196 [Kingdonia uniflora]
MWRRKTKNMSDRIVQSVEVMNASYADFITKAKSTAAKDDPYYSAFNKYELEPMVVKIAHCSAIFTIRKVIEMLY